jgi:hypothetical protein
VGLFSRQKGRRGEQQLVLYLAQRGYKAERILRQYQTPGCPDVKTLSPKEYTFELKTYMNNFKSIYDFYYSNRSDEFPIVGLVLGTQSKCCVAISTDFDKLEEAKDIIFDYPTDSQKMITKRLMTLNKKRGVADFLVLKDNNKPRLFLKYWI